MGLEELQTLNVKERFQVFEHHESDAQTKEMLGTVNVKRSPSILSKLARFHAKGMDVGVDDESLNGIPIEESSTEEEQEEDDGIEGEDADLIRAKRVQKEKPFHFTGMNDVKNRWEQGVEQAKDERREERKQEIQTIRSRLFMGKQGKMKEAYQQAVLEAESVRKSAPTTPVVEVCDTKSLKERFERGEVTSVEENREKEQEDMSVFESGISKKSRSIFMELDANASKAPQLSPVSPSKSTSEVIKKTREVSSVSEGISCLLGYLEISFSLLFRRFLVEMSSFSGADGETGGGRGRQSVRARGRRHGQNRRHTGTV